MKHLLTKYLNSVAVFEGPNDKGAPDPKDVAKEQREAIKVEVADSKQVDPLNPDVVEEEEEEEEDKEEDDPVEPDPKENETAEEKADRVAKEKEERKDARMQKRIDKLTASNVNAANEIAALKKQIAEKPVEGLTEEEVNRRAAVKAEELSAAKEADRLQKAFEKSADILIKSANKVDKDFEKKINDVAKETDILMPKYMVEILSDLDNENGHEILAQLANDEDLYEEICVLSERKMTQRLIRMSDKLKEEKKGKGKTQEREARLPNPIEPINDGINNRGNSLPAKPTENMEEFARIRAMQTEQRRKARGY